MKPVGIPAKAIENSSKKGSLVLDLFGGSGTTLIAAEQTSRICYTMELEPKYADVIVRRYIEWVGSSDAVFLERAGERIPYKELAINCV